MTHTYQITGLPDKDQLKKIQQVLHSLEHIYSVHIAVYSMQVTLNMHHHVPLEKLNAALAEAGAQRLEPIDHAAARMADSHQMHSRDKSIHQSHTVAQHHQKTTAGEAPHHDHQSDGHNGHGTGHHDHHRMMIRDFRRRFWVSLALTVPVVLLAPMIQEWLGVDWRFSGDRYLAFALSTVIYLYGGYPFLSGMKDEIRKRAPGMMTLIGLAISVAYIYSVAVVFGLEGETFFWELATLIVVMLLGHWLEMRSILGASRALEALAQLIPDEAHRINKAGNTEVVAVSSLQPDDIILIRPGEKIPADGEIVKGSSELNESMLTGESRPVNKTEGETVIAGSINGNGALRVRVKGTGDDTYLSKVIQMVQEAQGRKSKTQKLADRAAFWLTITALVVGVGTFLLWIIQGRELAFALERMVTVMVITCPHALGLAIPLVVAISTSVSARNGLLIRNRTAFENSRKVTTVVFDKTGTLTTGAFGVNSIVALGDRSEHELLRLAAALEANSEHPIARGIMAKVGEEKIETPAASNFQAITGKGVEATVEGKLVQVVSPGYLREQGIEIPAEAHSDAGETVVFVLVDGQLAGFIALSDTLRPESRQAIEVLHQNGIKTIMLTGDAKAVAQKVAKELQMDNYFAEVLPDQKLAKIRALQSEGEFVAMTGDGVNDAPALAQADVGIAVGSGTDVAAETADIILVESDPQDVTNLLLFGRATYRKMVQNLAWATGYNVFAIPLATGLVPGLMISPAVGAALMSLSTIICALNAQLLRRQLRRQ